jgi:hypothetical protein
MKHGKELLLVLILVFSLIALNFFVYSSVSQYNSLFALWVVFLPAGIVLLIFFLIQGLKVWLER